MGPRPRLGSPAEAELAHSLQRGRRAAHSLAGGTALQEQLGQRAWRGAKHFLRSFGIFTPLIAAVWVFEGRVVESRGSVIRADILTVVYPLGAALCGALFGALEPIADRGRMAAMFCGIVAITPWVAGIGVAMRPIGEVSILATVVPTAIIATILGAAFGYGYSKPIS